MKNNSFFCLLFCAAIMGCRSPVYQMRLTLDVPSEIACAVVRLSVDNHSGETIYLQKDAPVLLIVDEAGSIAKPLFSPGSYDADSLDNYVALKSGHTHIYFVNPVQDYELKREASYTITAGGGFTDAITHRKVVFPRVEKKFHYSSSCAVR